jgi:hypothetical protein
VVAASVVAAIAGSASSLAVASLVVVTASLVVVASLLAVASVVITAIGCSPTVGLGCCCSILAAVAIVGGYSSSLLATLAEMAVFCASLASPSSLSLLAVCSDSSLI